MRNGWLFPSLKRRGGRDINKKFPFRSEAAGVVSSAKVLKTHSETFRRTDHPGCAISVASRLFVNAQPSPPFQGGENIKTPVLSCRGMSSPPLAGTQLDD